MQAAPAPSVRSKLAAVLHTWTATGVGVVVEVAGWVVTYNQDNPAFLASLPPKAQFYGALTLKILGLALSIIGKGPLSAPPVKLYLTPVISPVTPTPKES